MVNKENYHHYKRISVIGAGAWGTALAEVISRQGNQVNLWAREADVVKSINTSNTNNLYLPNINLSKLIIAQNDLNDVLDCDLLLMVTPAQFMRSILDDLKGSLIEEVPIVLCSKGIETKTLSLMSEIAESIIPNNPLAVLSGPSFAIDVVNNKPTAVTLACKNPAIGKSIADSINLATFRPYSFARYWMHSGMLNVSGEKMSKSLGNFQTLGNAMDQYGARPLRLAMLQAHYRSLMELSEETMAGASGGIERIDAFFRRMAAAQIIPGDADDNAKKRFSIAMDNDLGTPDALAVIFESINAGNALLDSQDYEGAQSSLATVTELLEVLGLSQVERDTDDSIEELIQQREIARQEKNFEKADKIRDQLHSQGIEIEDTPTGTLWRYR